MSETEETTPEPPTVECVDVPDPGPVDWCKALNILDHKILCQTNALAAGGCNITSVTIDGDRVEAGSPAELLTVLVNMRKSYYANCKQQQAVNARGSRCATIAVCGSTRRASRRLC